MTEAIRGGWPVLRLTGISVLVWLAFLLALEPGNMVRASARGASLVLDQEIIRILFASLLAGCVSTPIQIELVRRFPLTGPRRLANIALHLAASLGLAVGLIVLAHVGVPFVLAADNPRLAQQLSNQIAVDAPLMTPVLAGISLMLHLRLQRQTPPAVPRAQLEARFPVQTRDGVVLIDVREIDWIEAQGNYAALHVGGATHLMRETLTRLSARLDADQFVRIHRGAIVNLARLKRVRPLSSGDAEVELTSGAELRASRTFAAVLRERLSTKAPS